jgi:hypothetical protein
MPSHVKLGCAEHHRATVERMVNLLPPTWLLEPQSGELFDSLDHCNRRLWDYILMDSTLYVKMMGLRRIPAGASSMYTTVLLFAFAMNLFK